jgi:hypothetical protein
VPEPNESSTGSLTWTVHRAREEPGKTAIVLAFIGMFLVFSGVFFGPVLALIAALVLFVALNTYFLPVTVAFSDAGVDIDKRLFRTHYDWKQFRRWIRTSGGIVLSPFSRRNYLDNFRGVHLLLPPDPTPVIASLEKRFAPPEQRLKLDDPPADEGTNSKSDAG